VRAGLVLPGVVAFYAEAVHNQQAALFGAFAAIAVILFTDYAGPWVLRARSYLGLVLATSVLVCLGTLCSDHLWISVAVMTAITLVILFSGVLSSIMAGSTTALVVSVVVSVLLDGPPSVIGDRLLGWVTGSAASIIVTMVVWPTPEVDPLQAVAAGGLRALARCLSLLEIRPQAAGSGLTSRASEADEIGQLRAAFFASRNPPSARTGSGRALIQVAERILLLEAVLQGLRHSPSEAGGQASRLLRRSEALLDRAAGTISSGDLRGLPALDRAVAELEDDRRGLVAVALASSRSRSPLSGNRAVALAEVIEPTFAGNEIAGLVADTARFAAAEVRERSRSWWRHVTGAASGTTMPPSRIWARARAHLGPDSVWFQTAVRGCVALGVSVLLAKVLRMEHAFWVSFGTLAVLRATADSTGRSALSALAGTVAGIVVATGVTLAVGSHIAVAWALLPLAVAFTALAPAWSFAASQAGFTVTLLLLFDIVSPQGWTAGIIRIEDMALGCAVSVGVGMLFWPHGAGAVLCRELADSLRSATDYLSASLRFALSLCDAADEPAPTPDLQRKHAEDAARRLDTALRQFTLEQRAAGTLPTARADGLALTAAHLRGTGDAVYDIWRDQKTCPGGRAAAKLALLQTAEVVERWYQAVAASLTGAAAAEKPLPLDAALPSRLACALAEDLDSDDPHRGDTAVRMMWSLNLLQAAARRVGQDLQVKTGLSRPATRRPGNPRSGGPPGRAPGSGVGEVLAPYHAARPRRMLRWRSTGRETTMPVARQGQALPAGWRPGLDRQASGPAGARETTRQTRARPAGSEVPAIPVRRQAPGRRPFPPAPARRGCRRAAGGPSRSVRPLGARSRS
jgi:uncharacterized membrane protein YccC